MTTFSTIKKALPAGEFDVEAFDAASKKDEFSVASLIKKIRESRFYQTLPDWISDYTIPPGTVACSLTPIKCMSKLMAMQKDTAFNVSPNNQLELVTTFNDVVIEPVGVSYVEDKTGLKVNLGINLSYLVPDMNDSLRVIHSSTADIVATDAKKDKSGNIVVPEWPEEFAVPVSNSTLVRNATGSTVSSRSRARDEIFRFLTTPANIVKCVRMHHHLGGKLVNFVVNDAMSNAMRMYYEGMNLKPLDDYATKVIGIDNSGVPCTSDMTIAYKMYFQSVGIRGGRDGKGLAHGFERFSMSRTMINTLNLVQDMINMSSLYQTRTVIVRDSAYLTTEQIRVLIHNKFRVISLNSTYEECVEDSKPGIYSSLRIGIQCFEFRVMSDAGIKPQYANNVIQMGPHYDAALSQIQKATRCFSLFYIDRRLKETKTLSFLPSATADTMQIIVATGVNVTFDFDLLIKRATMAISCRNRFIHYRRPFCTMDIMSKFVDWASPIYYPKLRVRDDVKVLDLADSGVNEGIRVTPLQVNVKQLTSEVENVEPMVNRTGTLALEALAALGEYFFLVHIAVNSGLVKFKFVDDLGKRWDNKFDLLLDVSEVELLGFYESAGKHDAVTHYYHIAAEKIQKEDLLSDEEENPVKEVDKIDFNEKSKNLLGLFQFNLSDPKS